MGLKKGAIIKVWKLYPAEKYTDCQVSSSHKKKDGTYETDYTGYLRFIGTAKKKIDGILQPGGTVEIGDIEVTAYYNKAKGVKYTNVATWDCEIKSVAGNKKSDDSDNGDFVSVSDGLEDDLPFN